MSVLAINSTNKAYISKENACNPLLNARHATNNLLIHLEKLLENVIAYQIKRGHFKKYYGILHHEKDSYRVVKVSYEGQAVYSNKEDRATQVEGFCEYIERLTEFYHSMGTQQIDVWRTALTRLESFTPQVKIDRMIDEYIRALPIQSQCELKQQLRQANRQCEKAFHTLSEVKCTNHFSQSLSAFSQKFAQAAMRFLAYLRQNLESFWKE